MIDDGPGCQRDSSCRDKNAVHVLIKYRLHGSF
jgi:hypothetical protein